MHKGRWALSNESVLMTTLTAGGSDHRRNEGGEQRLRREGWEKGKLQHTVCTSSRH